jgi:hypothetical protein
VQLEVLQVFVLHNFGGPRQRDIAARLEVSVNAMEAHIVRGLGIVEWWTGSILPRDLQITQSRSCTPRPDPVAARHERIGGQEFSQNQ